MRTGRLPWIAAGLGLAAALFRRRRAAAPTAPPQPTGEGVDPRAEELRRRLAEARTVVEERDEFEAAEVSVDEAEPAPANVDERRREVHDAARAAAEEMRGAAEDDER